MSTETAPSISEATTCPESVTVTSTVAPKPKKVTLRLRNIGDAPVLEKKLLMVNPSDTIASFSLTLRKLLNIKTDKSLFLYVDSCFAPSSDTTFETLSKCYSVKSTDKVILELQYSITPAYG